MKKSKLVKIEVQGGVARVIQLPKGIRVQVHDLDNEAAGEPSIENYEGPIEDENG